MGPCVRPPSPCLPSACVQAASRPQNLAPLLRPFSRHLPRLPSSLAGPLPTPGPHPPSPQPTSAQRGRVRETQSPPLRLALKAGDAHNSHQGSVLPGRRHSQQHGLGTRTCLPASAPTSSTTPPALAGPRHPSCPSKLSPSSPNGRCSSFTSQLRSHSQGTQAPRPGHTGTLLPAPQHFPLGGGPEPDRALQRPGEHGGGVCEALTHTLTPGTGWLPPDMAPTLIPGCLGASSLRGHYKIAQHPGRIQAWTLDTATNSLPSFTSSLVPQL